MINKIIVPLDGSALAEKALPYAASLTNQLKATLVLLRVAEARPLVVEFSQAPQLEAGNVVYSGNVKPNNSGLGVTAPEYTPAYSGNPYQTLTAYTDEQEDEDYLQKIKGTLVGAEAQTPLKTEQIQTRVVCGRSPKELAAIGKEEQGDLVVMTTHGRSGITLLMMGSIATNLIHQTNVPVILIKPTDSKVINEDPQPDITQPIVVTLDGSQDSEVILEAASNLALQLGVKLHLLQVVNVLMPNVGDQFYVPANYVPELEVTQLQEQATKYLQGLQADLQAKGLDCTISVIVGNPATAMVYNSEPVSRIAEYAQTVNAQLVAMATHARGRFAQVLLGSMSEKEVRENPLPVMLVKMPAHHHHELENWATNRANF